MKIFVKFKEKFLENIFFFMVLVYFITSVFCIFRGVESAWAQDDALLCHIPYVKKVIEKGFLGALMYPLAVMPPFFHWVVAVAHKVTGLDIYLTGKLVSFLVSFFTLCMLGRFFKKKRISSRWSLFLSAIFCFSWAFLSSSVSPVTDSFAVSIYIFILMCIAHRNIKGLILLVPVLIFTRQQYVVIPFALLLSVLISEFLSKKTKISSVERLNILVASLFGLMAIFFIFYVWGGFIPHQYRVGYSARNLLSLGALSLSITYVGFLILLASAMGVFSRFLLKELTLGLLISFFTFFILPTDYSKQEGRFGAIFWDLSSYVSIFGISIVSVLCGVYFFAFLYKLKKLLWVESLDGYGFIYLLLILGFVGIFCLQKFCYLRYIDPIVGLSFFFFIYHLSLDSRFRTLFIQ